MTAVPGLHPHVAELVTHLRHGHAPEGMHLEVRPVPGTPLTMLRVGAFGLGPDLVIPCASWEALASHLRLVADALEGT